MLRLLLLDLVVLLKLDDEVWMCCIHIWLAEDDDEETSQRYLLLMISSDRSMYRIIDSREARCNETISSAVLCFKCFGRLSAAHILGNTPRHHEHLNGTAY